VLSPINLYNQACFKACKVDNVVVNRDLAAEAKPIDLPLTQQPPQGALRVRHVPAELTSVLVWHWCGGYPPSSAPGLLRPGVTPSLSLRDLPRKTGGIAM